MSEETMIQGVEAFGRDVIRWIWDDTESFFGMEISEEICEMLKDRGLVERVIYDPEKHGEIDNAEPGQEVWLFTDAMRDAARPMAGRIK